ncbi:MAG: GHMP kinase [Armatimonadetes bacterium]|nr:GHMP kinase [Armatimonadota bacterium]
MPDRKLVVSAPGRICLFGEHQDFLGLNVVAAAIDLRIRIEGTPKDSPELVMDMPDIDDLEVIDPSQKITYVKRRDYLRSAVKVVKRRGWPLPCGFSCRMTSRVPINAGVASSSAMIIAWIRFLMEATGDPERHDPRVVAALGHQAEVLEFSEPGGMMDHFSTAIGGTVYIDCSPPYIAHGTDIRIEGFVLSNSLETKETTTVLGNSKQDVLGGVDYLIEHYPGFNLHTTPREEVWNLCGGLPEHMGRKVRANLINRDLCEEARALLQTDFAPRDLGRLLDAHHEQLRDGLGVSTSKIEGMIRAAKDAGALGCKINGSGGGGCMFAYAPGREKEVAAAMDRAGGQSFIVHFDEGVRVES